jgi:hypothetical protein
MKIIGTQLFLVINGICTLVKKLLGMEESKRSGRKTLKARSAFTSKPSICRVARTAEKRLKNVVFSVWGKIN